MKPTASGDFFSFLKARSPEIIAEIGLKKKLISRKNLRVKLGIDPTTPDLHLGHIVPLRLLRSFQDAGHQAVLIIGDFTGQIGDPSGKSRARRQMSSAEAKANEQTYRLQIRRILNLSRTEIRHNSEWHGRMKSGDFLDLLRNFSLKSVWERDDFQERLAAGKPVYLHEAMYAVLQAYDSVAVRADVEIGGLDQKLNLLAGRELQSRLGQSPQDIILLPYLIGLDGKAKMSKSVGNTINLSDSAKDMFGKVMSIPDGLIMNYAELAAWMPAEELKKLERDLAGGKNPRDSKLKVAQALVELYHGAKRAQASADEFIELFSKKRLPPSIPSIRLEHRSYRPIDLLLILGAGRSKSEGRRLLAGRALEINGRAVEAHFREVRIEKGDVIRLGKKKFLRVR